MDCKHCHRPIVLVPSATERASRDVTGKTAEYYTKLFEYHAKCTLELRSRGTEELLRRRDADAFLRN